MPKNVKEYIFSFEQVPKDLVEELALKEQRALLASEDLLVHQVMEYLPFGFPWAPRPEQICLSQHLALPNSKFQTKHMRILLFPF